MGIPIAAAAPLMELFDTQWQVIAGRMAEAGTPTYAKAQPLQKLQADAAIAMKFETIRRDDLRPDSQKRGPEADRIAMELAGINTPQDLTTARNAATALVARMDAKQVDEILTLAKNIFDVNLRNPTESFPRRLMDMLGKSI